MSDTEASKRPRTVINYAVMDSLDISDDDEFSGFSSPMPRPVHHKSAKSSSKNEKSKLQKKRKLSKQRDDAETTAPSEEDSDCAPARSTPRPRPALQDKLFQRDLEAALELSRQCAGISAPEENKENLPGSSFSPPRPIQSSPTGGITPVIVPVEIHGPKTPPAHPSPVCRKGNTDVHILPRLLKTVPSEQIISAHTFPGSDASEVTGPETTFNHKAVQRCEAEPTPPVNSSKKYVKRKARVIESDDDDFDPGVHPNRLTSSRVIENKPKGPVEVSPKSLPSFKNSELEAEVGNSEHHKAFGVVGEDSAQSAMKRGRLAAAAAPPPEADLAASGRGKRTRRPVSFLLEPDDTDSEAEWAELDEVDEDDLSQSEGSDFEPSPKKNKKTAPSNTKKENSVKTTRNNKQSRGAIKAAVATPTNSKPPEIKRAVLPPKEPVLLPVLRTANTPAPTSHVSKASKPVSASTMASATSLSIQSKQTLLPNGGGRPTSSAPVLTSVRSSPLSAAPRAGLARAAFKCPVMSGAATAGSPAVRGPSPSGTLRLGLSRKSSFKPLHPNATIN